MTPGTIEATSNPDAASLPPMPSDGQSKVGVSPRKRRRRLGRKSLLLGVIAVLIVIGIVSWAVATTTAPPPRPAPAATATSQALTAHGVVEPIARASIATINGGVVTQLSVRVGQVVDAQQPVAQVGTSSASEVLTAPWRGTVMGIAVHLGDTVLPGTVVATIGDLSRYQVETTDVDEYLIGHIRTNQAVTMTVEALDGIELRGAVKSVALQQQSAAGVSNYPIVIDLGGPNPDLRPGMTVRITFLDSTK